MTYTFECFLEFIAFAFKTPMALRGIKPAFAQYLLRDQLIVWYFESL